MKRPTSKKRSSGTTHKATRQRKCPHCAELLGLGVHICPMGCCYVAVGKESYEAVCPYCENTFETRAGHICLELLKLTDPA
ncbi:MAG: hypothetical protein L0287_04600 [Anaerolineae bacterium]|nr:hypothetical protein [Anaerolineae bacterium]